MWVIVSLKIGLDATATTRSTMESQTSGKPEELPGKPRSGKRCAASKCSRTDAPDVEATNSTGRRTRRQVLLTRFGWMDVLLQRLRGPRLSLALSPGRALCGRGQGAPEHPRFA